MPEVTFGGIKESGIGYRHGGAESLRKYCNPHSIIVTHFQFKREFYWFPYTKSVANLFKGALDLLFKH
jgi:hypothetical protein